VCRFPCARILLHNQNEGVCVGLGLGFWYGWLLARLYHGILQIYFVGLGLRIYLLFVVIASLYPIPLFLGQFSSLLISLTVLMLFIFMYVSSSDSFNGHVIASIMDIVILLHWFWASVSNYVAFVLVLLF